MNSPSQLLTSRRSLFVWMVFLLIPFQVRGQSSIDYAKAQSFHRAMRFDSAIMLYKRFLDNTVTSGVDQAKAKEVRKRIFECESGKKLLLSPRDFIITNLGPGINSTSADYAPVVSENETLLVFTSRRPEGNLSKQKSTDGDYFEEVFFSRRQAGVWTPAQPIGPPVNTPFHNSNIALSADGRQLFLYTDSNEGDILLSEMVNGKWTQPKPLPFPVNTKDHESSVAITSDGNKLFVASERAGGMGGSDIYLVEKNSAGQWSSAKNLGPSINTEWDDDSPFIDYDGQALYFSSKGHNSIGGYDIFRSLLKGDAWTPAENLGLPINTTSNDSYFVSTADGARAYYSSVRSGGFGEEDIYMITLPAELVRDETPSGVKTESRERKTVSMNEPTVINPLIIYFKSGSSQLSPSDEERLGRFLEEAKKTGNSSITIDGHTDSTGPERENKSLSISRSNSVKRYTQLKGFDFKSIIINGWGETRPIASNDDEKEGRELNRRVVVRVISN